jgi:hypothetical protein
MDDLFQDPNDKMELDPNDLGPVFHEVLTHQLAKLLAEKYRKPWEKETELQEAISRLLASCYGRGLKTLRITVTRKNGQTTVRDLDVDKIAKTRVLQ